MTHNVWLVKVRPINALLVGPLWSMTHKRWSARRCANLKFKYLIQALELVEIATDAMQTVIHAQNALINALVANLGTFWILTTLVDLNVKLKAPKLTTTPIKLQLMECARNANHRVKLAIHLLVSVRCVLTTCSCSEGLVYNIALENGIQMK